MGEININDNRKWLYDALTGKGVQMGSYEDFDKNVDEHKDWLYETAKSMGLNVGDYDAFGKAMSNEIAITQSALPTQQPSGGSLPPQLPTRAGVWQPPYQPGLKEQVQQQQTVVPPLRPQEQLPEMPSSPWSEQELRKRKDLTAYNLEAQEDAQIRRENDIPSTPAGSDDAIFTKYQDMFSLTGRGKLLTEELAGIERGVFEKYLNEYKGTDEYKALAGKRYASREEANREMNEKFMNRYGMAIEDEMRPYVQAYHKELNERYGDQIGREVMQLRKRELDPQIDEMIGSVKDQARLLDDVISKRKREIITRYRGKPGHESMEEMFGRWQFPDDLATEQEWRELRSTDRDKIRDRALLREAEDWISETRDLVDAAVNHSGFWRGVANTTGDPDTWSFGFGDLIRSRKLRETLEKADRGEKLSEAEKTYLKAAVMNMAANTYYRSDLSGWYKAGETTGASLPFMLEFAVNPISASGSAVAKSLLKYGMKKFGKAAMKKGAAKATARLLGDAAAAAGMTLTTGLPGVVADTERRLAENYEYDIDENGEPVVRKTGNMGAGEALGKSLASRTIENQSEMIFNAFGGMGRKAFGAIEKYLPGGAKRFMSEIKNSGMGRVYRNITGNPTLREVMRRTQFHGYGEEVFEEVYNNFANIPLGDMTFEEATDLDTNIDILLGLAPTSLAFGMVGLGGMVRDRRRINRNLEKIRQTMDDQTRRTFDEWMKSLEDKSHDELRDAVKKVIMDKNLTPELKKEMLYAGYLIAQGKAAQDIRDGQTETERAVDDTYEEGMNTSPEEQHNVGADAESAMQTLFDANETLGNIVQEMTRSDATIADLEEELQRRGATKGDALLARNAFLANARMAGVIDAAKEEADAAVDAYAEQLLPYCVESEDGSRTVTIAVMNVNGQPSQVYVMDDGSASGAGMAIIMDETGKKSAVDPKSLSDLNRQTYDEMVEEYRQQMSGRAQEITEWALNHNAKTQVPETGMVFASADNTFLMITGQVGNSWQVLPAKLDPKTGAYVPVTDTQGTTMSTDEVLKAQDDYYNAVEANEKGQPQTESPQEQPQQTATERVPKDEQGNPIYEQAETPDLAWDAIVEQTDGDEVMAQTVADGMVADKEAALNKLEKAKPRGGVTVAEKIASEKARKAAIDAAKQELAVWRKIAGTANRRKQAVEAERRRAAEEATARQKAEDERMRAEREEAERVEREALNGVPDMVDDTPQDARARGYRRVNGHKVDRQEPVQAVLGKEVAVKFSDDITPGGRVAVIDAGQLQPSHIQGVRNPLHFVDEAQPKERNDEASVLSARKIAENIRPEEITSSITAYTGAPTVNMRGEVIQGNNRSSALREMWNSQPEQSAKYKQYLIDHAQEFGLNAEDVIGMQRPVLVNMLDVDDAEAINLGQFVAQDTESGGTERIKPKNALQRMGNDMRSFANLLLASGDEETSFAGLVDNNGVEVLKWMNQKGYITPTQYKSAFDSKGNLTAEAKNDLKGIMYQSIFKGGSTRLEEMFNALPAKAQKAILATAFRDYDSPNAERMIEDIQDSIRAYYSLALYKPFVEAKNWKEARMAVEEWKRQYQLDDVSGESYLPAENFSNFALHLATMYKGETQRNIQDTFNKLYDLIQGTQEADLFKLPDNMPRTLAQAIKEVLNIDYNGRQRKSTNAISGMVGNGSDRRERGGDGIASPGGRVQNGERSAELVQGDASDSGETKTERNIQKPLRGSDEVYAGERTGSGERQAGIVSDRLRNDEQGGTEGSASERESSLYTSGSERVKDSASPSEKQEKGEENSENAGIGEKIAEAEATVDTDPTEAQKKAGNYKKGHVQIGAFDVTIENPKGSVRSGVDAVGNKWETTMQNTYGYMRGTEGVDGDHIDVFLSDDMDGWNGRKVFVVDQYNEDGSFDEHKVMLGFNEQDEAETAYLSNYEKGWEKGRKIVVTPVNMEDFEKWIDSSHRKTKPFAEYKGVKQDTANEAGEKKGKSPYEVALEELGDIEQEWNDKIIDYVAEHYPTQATISAKTNSPQGLKEKAAMEKDETLKRMRAEAKAAIDAADEKVTALYKEEQEDEKKNSVRDNTMDTGTTSNGSKRNGTATPQNTVSTDKGSEKSGKTSGKKKKAEPVSPRQLGEAYESGDAAKIAKAEKAMRDYIESQEDIMALANTYYGRKIEYEYYAKKTIGFKETPRGKLLSFLAEVCKESLMRKYGVPKQAFGSEKTRLKLANETTDPNVLDVLSNDRDSDVKRAVINNANTSDELLRYIMENNHHPLYQEAEEALERRGVKPQRIGENAPVTKAEKALRSAIVRVLRKMGLKVFDDAETGQRVLDWMNGKGIKKSVKKPALPEDESSFKGTVIPFTDTANIRKNLDELASEYENLQKLSVRNVIADLGRALGAEHKGSKSQYITIEAKNGDVVTIRVADHNASTDRMDNAGRDNAISIVISRKQNEGIQGNGNAHITEYFYSDKALREAGGEAVAGIARSIKQALYSGEYKDTTGLAEVQEVNAETIREHRVFHGSGADFDAFDHSHMGEGEGAQAYGWGSYVTEVEGIGRSYAESYHAAVFKSGFGDFYLNKLQEALRAGRSFEEVKRELLEYHKELYQSAKKDPSIHRDFISDYEALQRMVKADIPQRHLYTVEIPDDTGSNYLDWSGRIESLIDRGVVTIEEAEARDMASGRDVYEYLAEKLGSDKKASEFLSSLGFTGIKYPAQATTGGRADGAKNYVIFKESDMKITDHVRFFKTAEGEAYGFTVGGKIYLDPRMAKADTPIHEYTHLWADALRQMNPKEWKNIVELMKGTPVWEEVKKSYPELETDDEIADEVLATYSGQRGAERLREEQRKIAENDASVLEKAEAISVLERVKDALKKFWKNVADFLHIHFTTAEEVADRVLSDLLNGVNPLDYTRADSRLRMQEQAEEQAIIEQAKANGTYMKAPNGKPTNLTEKQWVQVRTKAFKKWFGDWEKAARIEKLRHSEPIEVEFNGQYELNRDSAQDFILKNLRGEYTIADTGENVTISKVGAKKVTSHGAGNDAHLKSIVAIPQLLENAIFIEEAPNEKGNGKYDSYRYYVVGLKIGNEDYTARLTIGVKNGKYYYDHYLTDIEKGNLIEIANSFTPTGDAPIPSYTDIKDSRLLSLLQTNSSKVVDENGEPMVVFHGTPLSRNQITPNSGWQADGKTYIRQEAPFYTFKGGEYSGLIFTSVDANKAWSIAETRALSILDDEQGNEQWTGEGYVYDLYVDLKNPFDPKDENSVREILQSFGNEIPTLSFIGGKGNNVSLEVALKMASSKNNSWLITETPEFLSKVKEFGYDGLVGYDEGVKYIAAFSPNQLKDAYDNTGAFSAENDDIRYSRKSDAQEKRDLVAVHNITAEKLAQALELGGFPMPSIAVTKADVGHTTFGDISLVFGKESIDPSDRRNKVYGEDAWTPVFPQVGYKLNEEKTSDIYRRANKAGRLPMFNPSRLHPDNLQDKIDRLDSKSLAESFKDDYGMKQFYLSENGNAVKEFEQHEVEKYPEASIGLFEKMLEGIGLERLKNDNLDALRDKIKPLIAQHKGIDFDGIKPYRAKVIVDNSIRNAIDYAENGNKRLESDVEATQKKIDERIDPKKYEAWLEDLFAGIVEKKGIRNAKDPFTPSGNSRKWEELYDRITLDNVVKGMQQQAARGGHGLFGGSIFGAAQEEYKSIDEIREAARDRIRTIDEADYKAQRDAITDRLSAIKIPGVEESFSDTMDMVQNIQDAVARSHTPKGIHKYLKDFYPRVTMQTAEEIADIVKDIQKMTARYFEAKPYRSVGFDEVRLAVVPSDADANLVAELERRGIPVRRYEKGNEAERKQIVESATDEMDLRFRMDGGALTDEKIQEVNRKFNEDLSALNEDNADKVTLELGTPSDVLLAAGVTDKPMKLYGNKVIKKMKKYGFSLSELENLPAAVADPIAVFDNLGRTGNRSILTELKTKDGNFLVTIDLGKAKDVDFNIVSSVFGKTDNKIVDWINKGYVTYINKGKALGYLYYPAPIAETPKSQELSDATKIVENFENPKIEREEFSSSGDYIHKAAETVARAHEEKVTAAVNDLSGRLNTPVRVVHSVDELPANSEARRRIEQGRNIKGWFDPSTGEVVVYLPNAFDAADAVRTVLHEAVGHRGLRELLGAQEFDRAMMDIYRLLPLDIRSEIAGSAVKDHGGNMVVAVEEYLARQAENNETPSWWERVVSAIRNLLRRAGINLELSGNDVKYLLWRGRRNLEQGDAVQYARDRVMRNRLDIDRGRKTLFRETAGKTVKKDKQVDAAQVRSEYEKRMIASRFLLSEGYVDSMKSLDEFQKLIEEETGEKIRDFENAYQAENALTSATLAQTEEFKRRYMDPIVQTLAAFVRSGVKAETVSDWFITKHGVERNREMAIRQAIAGAARSEAGRKLKKMEREMAKAGDKPMTEREKKKMLLRLENEASDKLFDVWVETKKNVWNGGYSWADQERILNTIAVDNFGADLAQDYSGLSSRYASSEESTFTDEAMLFVEEFEKGREALCSDMLERVAMATNRISDKQLDGGLMDIRTRERIRDMFRYYVPLRGWSEETAEDVYNYLKTDVPVFNAPLKKMKGRTSWPDDPLPTIASMAESGIAQANRNRMKQRFLMLVENHPTDLVSISDVYVQLDNSSGEYTVIQPQIPHDATPEEAARYMEEFRRDMEEKANEEDSPVRRVSELGNIPYRVPLTRELNEHIIVVKRDGREYMLTVNGNPRLAQAVNGLTNPDNEATGGLEQALNMAKAVTRFMSANFTTRNPEFVASNFMRDMLYANDMVHLKESPGYAARFHTNFLRFNPKTMAGLIRKYENDTLDMNNKTEKYFRDFMLNGGETGYTSLKEISRIKKEMAKDIRDVNKVTLRRGIRLLEKKLDLCNRSVEICARFTAFVTSRDAGRSVSRSIWDAKEITVNFNKKGSGGKMIDWKREVDGKWRDKLEWMGVKIALAGSSYFRAFYAFFNASMQGVVNIFRAARRHPGRFSAMMGGTFALGMLGAWMGYDDDESGYGYLPEWTRRNNICFSVGDVGIKIPLPHIFKTFYGLGELAMSVMLGKERGDGWDVVEKAGALLSQLLPIDMYGEGGLKTLVPTAATPPLEVSWNEDWTGSPIYRESSFNENMPEWTKAYESTATPYVVVAKYLNKWTSKDGDGEYDKGWANINPGAMEHIVNGYLGGVTTFASKLGNTIEMVWNKDKREVRNIPVANRFLWETGPRQEEAAVKREYFENLKFMDDIHQKERGYLKKIKETDDILEFSRYQTMFNKLVHSDEYRKYLNMKEGKKTVDKLREAYGDDPTDEQNENLIFWMQRLNEMAYEPYGETEGAAKTVAR